MAGRDGRDGRDVAEARDSEKNRRLVRTDHVANVDEPVTPCPELPRVHALADGELHGLEAARVRRHARRCAECRSELPFLRRLAVAVAVAVAAGLLPER